MPIPSERIDNNTLGNAIGIPEKASGIQGNATSIVGSAINHKRKIGKKSELCIWSVHEVLIPLDLRTVRQGSV